MAADNGTTRHTSPIRTTCSLVLNGFRKIPPRPARRPSWASCWAPSKVAANNPRDCACSCVAIPRVAPLRETVRPPHCARPDKPRVPLPIDAPPRDPRGSPWPHSEPFPSKSVPRRDALPGNRKSFVHCGSGSRRQRGSTFLKNNRNYLPQPDIAIFQTCL